MSRMRNPGRGPSALLFALALLSAGTSVADEVPSDPSKYGRPTAEVPAAKPTAPQPDKDGFVPESRPMNGPTVDESIPAAPLVGAAYGFLWLAVLGYVVMTARGLRKVESDLAELDAKLSKLANKS